MQRPLSLSLQDVKEVIDWSVQSWSVIWVQYFTLQIKGLGKSFEIKLVINLVVCQNREVCIDTVTNDQCVSPAHFQPIIKRVAIVYADCLTRVFGVFSSRPLRNKEFKIWLFLLLLTDLFHKDFSKLFRTNTVILTFTVYCFTVHV